MIKKLLVFTSIILILNGCKKIDELTKFTIDYDESVVIPSSSGLSLPFNIFTPDIETNSESTFEVNDTRKDLVEEIKLTKLTLTITSPSGGDFSFLESISVFISAGDIPEEKMAWKDEIPSGIGKVLEMEVTTLDLKEFIKEDIIELRLNTVTDEYLTTDYHIDLHAEFFVDAKILGQ